MIATTDPRAWASPVETAAWWPKFRVRKIPRNRGSRAASWRIIASDRSVLPSETRRNSKARKSRAPATARSLAPSSGRFSSSL